MPRRDKCIPPDPAPTPDPEPEPIAVTPPTIDPNDWEAFEGFRETFLLYFSHQPDNAALRTVGTLLYDLILESGGILMPDHPEGWARAQVRAVLADLRFVQGFLDSLTKEAEGAGMDPYQEHLYRFAGARAVAVGKVADEIDAHLGSWRGEVEL